MLDDLKSEEQVLGNPEGLPVTRVLARLISSFPAIEQVSFVRFRPAPGLDERLSKSDDPALDIRETAEDLWRTYGIPFWDAILAICMKRGEIPDQYVDLAILHDPAPDEVTLVVEARQLSEESIQLMVDELEEGTALAFSSRVELRDGRTAHIPLMDFRCPPSASNCKILKRALRAIGQNSGLLAESGRSYHFYGFHLQSRDEWIQFLALSMLFSPIVDVRYVAHRLIDGACRLRISASRNKAFTPVVREVFS
jgi:hypothetical protein